MTKKKKKDQEQETAQDQENLDNQDQENQEQDKTMENLFSILGDVVQTGFTHNNKKVLLAFCATEISLLDSKYFCKRSADTDHITDKSLSAWCETIYKGGLNKFFENKSFKEFRSQRRSFYDALKDISLVVQFLMGNFKGGSYQLDKIPFCKISLNEEGQIEDIIDYGIEEEGNIVVSEEWEKSLAHFEGQENKMFVRPTAVYGIHADIKKRVKIGGKDISDLQTMKVFDPTITELQTMAEKIVNFAKPRAEDEGEGGENEITDFIKDVDSMLDRINKMKKDDTLKHFMEGSSQIDSIVNMMLGFLQTYSHKGQFKSLFYVIKNINDELEELSKGNKELQSYIKDNNLIFYYDEGLQDQLKTEIVRQLNLQGVELKVA